jgi:hypothetical protein
MAMSHSALKSALQSAFTANMPSPTAEQISAFSNTADAMATAIITCVSSATITYTTGLANGGGAVTGVFGNTIT